MELDEKREAAWYTFSREEVLERLAVDPERGLTSQQAQERLARYGPNELVETGLKNPLLILWEQLTEIMVVVLIVAAVISLALGDLLDAVAILVIVILNAVLGFVQEFRAERAMAALKERVKCAWSA